MRKALLVATCVWLCQLGLAASLSSDGSIGKVIDCQGIVAVKPVMRQRWSPVDVNMRLEPGDWLRTDVRGGNAVRVRLGGQAEAILGPGTMSELPNSGTLRLLRGETEISVPEGAKFALLAPGQKTLSVKGTSIHRVREGKLEELSQEPNWLKHFKGTVTTESMGSLVAKVEGRNVPLTVGYHKVTVDIRDQIARTVIEESFVNHTDRQLEGIFYFPLPQDASISGFGMWINGELVEADVVEKQRAREIYETILREKRDPGLLEWTGGNIFKARIFPIFGHSEKRVKITYTQVLPLKGSRYRYRYALQSELLKQHPLRELAIDVRIHSALPLKDVGCPTHETRLNRTKHSAHVEFSAQEYTPERDLEVEVAVDHRKAPLVLIPHQRGEDGYFLVLLTPPDAGGEWQREILPDGDPLELLILADTSGSMDRGSRARHDVFLAALLSSLGEKDTFNLATCDVACEWFAEEPVSVDETNVMAARDFLAARGSLGWSDLDKVFASALQRSGVKTHVVYVGDGIVTTGDADPIAFGKRLRQLHEDAAGTFHAVATSSSYESVVLKAIASLGGGSARVLAGKECPQAAAYQLLSEISQPTIRDLRIEFEGLRAARVYPEELPNLPAGSQQIVLGRYLPEGRDVAAEVVVTGIRDGKPVRFRAPVSLKGAEHGNSFIPRLWARLHLDFLLEQGRSQTIKQEIIALSEEYNIMTPYTSFLVLESDADRRRFKVKRRFRMRDGEKFFADGRDAASFELLQKQMRLAGNWRLGLRRQLLQELVGLGRVMPPAPRPPMVGPYPMRRDTQVLWDQDLGMSRPGPGRYRGDMRKTEDGIAFPGTAAAVPGEGPSGGELPAEVDTVEDVPDEEDPDAAETPSDDAGIDEEVERPELQQEVVAGEPGPPRPPGGDVAGKRRYDLGRAGRRADTTLWRDRVAPVPTVPQPPAVRIPLHQINSLFPRLAAPPSPQPARKTKWPEEARRLSEKLLRREALASLEGGVEFHIETERVGARTKRVFSVSHQHAIVYPDRWLTRSGGHWSQTLLNWCDKQERGTLSESFLLGRRRKPEKDEWKQFPLPLQDYSITSLEQSYWNCVPTIKSDERGVATISLTQPRNPGFALVVRIDTTRGVALSITQFRDGKQAAMTEFSKFVEAAGSWWATEIATKHGEGRTSHHTTLKVRALEPGASSPIPARLACRETSLLLSEPLPTVEVAKQALADKEAVFEHQLMLLAHFAQSQRWELVHQHLEAAEKLARDKPGVRWLRDAVLKMSRRHAELKQRLLAVAKQLAGRAEALRPGDVCLADYIYNQANGVLQASEMLELLDMLAPAYSRPEMGFGTVKAFQQRRMCQLRNAGRPEEAFALQRKLAEQYPDDTNLQAQYLSALRRRGDYERTLARVEWLLTKSGPWAQHEEQHIWNQHVQFLQGQGRHAELLPILEKWLPRNPQSLTPYQQYLACLIRTGRMEKAHAVMASWMREGRQQSVLAASVYDRLMAAVCQALGRGHNMHTGRIEPRWLDPLAEVATFFVRHKTHAHIAHQILGHSQFRQSDQWLEVCRRFVTLLAERLEKLTVREIASLVGWVFPNGTQATRESCLAIAEGILRRWQAEEDAQARTQLACSLTQTLSCCLLGKEHCSPFISRVRQRWEAEGDDAVRHEIGQAIVSLLSARGTPEELLSFLRRRWQKASDAYRPQYAHHYFETLLRQPWSPEYEDEAFDMLRDLAPVDAAHQDRTATLARALHRLVDRLIAARYRAAVESVAHQEKLSRTERAALRRESRRKARQAIAQRLDQEAERQPKELRPWLTIERLHLQVVLGHNPRPIAGECWEILGAEPLPPDQPISQIQSMLMVRALAMLEYLATRPKAEPELADRLLAYYGKALVQRPGHSGWRGRKHRLLLIVDRPEALEKALRQWVRPGEADTTWRVSLAYLMAEQKRITEAIVQFEAIRQAGQLAPPQLRTLADWYLVEDEKEKHEQALFDLAMAQPEYTLASQLDRELGPWQRGQDEMPPELDPKVIRIFTVLFRKSQYPQNYVYRLQQFYRYTKDFRLLRCLAEGMTGHTPARVYPLLEGLQSVLDDMRDEATADSILEQLAEVRERADTKVDQRALDFLTMQVERRAADVLNQPGPRIERALAAMQRAFKGEWLPGERWLMADLLYKLGRISRKPLADEQLRELRALHRDEQKGSAERLRLAEILANALWSHYSEWDESIVILEAALEEFRNASGGTLPPSAWNAFGTLRSRLQSRKRHARAEEYLLAELERAPNRQRVLQLTRSLYQVYHNALYQNVAVSLGSGERLYRALEKLLLEALKTDDHSHRYSMVCQLCNLYPTGKRRKYQGATEALRRLAWERVPPLLKRHTTSYYQRMVTTVANTLRSVLGHREGLAYLIERIENEPTWLRYTNHDAWRAHARTLDHWRPHVKPLGELEGRLLKIVTNELRHDLITRQPRDRRIYHPRCGSRFWREKVHMFARVAQEVLDEHAGSSVAVTYIVDYFEHGLHRRDLALAALLGAYQRGILDESWQVRLVGYLGDADRYEEALPIIRAAFGWVNESAQSQLVDVLNIHQHYAHAIALSRHLIERRPEELRYRCRLMRIYFRAGQKQNLRRLRKATDAYFRQKSLWTESAMVMLAEACFSCQLYEHVVTYYNEAIPLHQRTRPRRGIGNGILSGYYGQLSQAHAALGQTPEAVEAACGAIVSWGQAHGSRASALQALKNVLRKAPDLEAYVLQLDRQVQENGLENPIVRKALGQVYLEKRDYAKAVAQLRLAVAIQPNDAEIHKALVAAHDQQADKEGAIQQLLESTELSRRDLKLYRNLGDRYAALDRPTDAERAYTTMVEMQPNESESHTMLAEIRQRQNRWPEAVPHWRQVVRIRSLKPTGYLKLAEAQIHEKRWDEAKESLELLLAKRWPTRFGDMHAKARALLAKVERSSE